MLTQAAKQAIATRFMIFRVDYCYMTQTELAKAMGVTQKTISFIENLKTLPNQRVISYLMQNYNLNPEWLWTGKDDPTSKETESPELVANLQARIVVLEKQVKQLTNQLKELMV